VFTRGDVLAQGNLDLSGAAHIYGAVEINSNVQINGHLDLNGRLLLQNVGTANMSAGIDDGSFRRLNITTLAYNSNASLVFLTNRSQTNASAIYSVEPVGLNTFQIVASNRNDGSAIQYMIIN
jgi:hypothetical protein